MLYLYEITVSLNLILIAATITVFVFAVTLLGKSIEISESKKRETYKQQKKELEKELEDIQTGLQKIKEAENWEEVKQFTKKQKELQKKIEKNNKELKNIHKKYRLFTVNRGVIYPSLFFLLSLTLSGLAKFLLNPFLWIGALFLMGIGGYRLIKCFKIIEDVSIVSEEMAQKKAIETSKAALLQYEETKRPEITFSFKDTEPPFNFQRNSKEKISFSLFLTHGDVARNVKILFLIPPEFKLPGYKTWPQEKKESKFFGYSTIQIKWGEPMVRGLSAEGYFEFETPSQSNKFILGYRLVAEEYDSGRKEFEVIIN